MASARPLRDDIVEKLKKISVGLGDFTLKARFANLRAEPMPKRPAEFGKFVTYETEEGLVIDVREASQKRRWPVPWRGN